MSIINIIDNGNHPNAQSKEIFGYFGNVSKNNLSVLARNLLSYFLHYKFFLLNFYLLTLIYLQMASYSYDLVPDHNTASNIQNSSQEMTYFCT